MHAQVLKALGSLPLQLATVQPGLPLVLLSESLLPCSMVFAPNTSPLAGQEGKHLTAAKIGERLQAEAATSVSLQVSLSLSSVQLLVCDAT